MRIAVTGGAGFIGTNLYREFLSRGHDVSVVDDLSTGYAENVRDTRIRFVQGSILDSDVLDRGLDGAHAVVHLAALGSVPRSVADPLASHGANATGTLMVLEAARRHGNLHTVVASSSSVYGGNPVLPKHEELAPRPLSPYACSKLATEAYALSWGATFGLPTLAFRFFNVFGPLQSAAHAYAAVIPLFVDAALAGLPVTIHGDGSQSRDFTYVGSVVDAIVQAVERGVTSPGPVNLAFGTRVTLLEVVSALEGILGYEIQKTFGEGRAGDVPHSQAQTDRLLELFPGLTPVLFEDGLRATVDWMRQSRTSPPEALC